MEKTIFEENCISFLGPTFLVDPEGNELRPYIIGSDDENSFMTESRDGAKWKVTYIIEEV